LKKIKEIETSNLFMSSEIFDTLTIHCYKVKTDKSTNKLCRYS